MDSDLYLTEWQPPRGRDSKGKGKKMDRTPFAAAVVGAGAGVKSKMENGEKRGPAWRTRNTNHLVSMAPEMKLFLARTEDKKDQTAGRYVQHMLGDPSVPLQQAEVEQLFC